MSIFLRGAALLPALSLVAVLGLAGCGQKPAEDGAGAPTGGTAETSKAETQPKPTDGADGPDQGDLTAESGEGLPATMNEDAFLASYAQLEGVTIRPSGLMYRVLKAGAGASPTLDNFVRVAYKGTLMDGKVFDQTSEGQSAEFQVGALIVGWQEALTLMKVGDKWEIVLPSDLAYGERGVEGVIPPGSPLVFEVELLEILR